MTYVYSDSTAVLGPLAKVAEPHSYDLCERHAARLTAPRGWEVVRLQNPAAQTEPAGSPGPNAVPYTSANAATPLPAAQESPDLSRPAVAPTDDWTVLADVLRASQEANAPELAARTSSSPVFEETRRPRHARTNLFVVRNQDSVR